MIDVSVRLLRERLRVFAPRVGRGEQLAERGVAAGCRRRRCSTVISTETLKKTISTCTVSVARPYALSRPPS